MNGKFVDCQEDLSHEDPDITKFLGSEVVNTEPNLVKFPKKHPSENIKFAFYKSKYSYLTESTEKNDNHQGGDFLQEDALGRVSTFLKRGNIFDIDNFASAARQSQAHQISERDRGNLCSNSKSRRPKYENEVQSLCAMILDKQERPVDEEELGNFHEDVLDISKIGFVNFKQYFCKKIRGIPTTSIKLTPAFITKANFEEYNKIENKTKEVIVKEIKLMMPQTVFEDSNEKSYFESKANRSNVKKDELINLFYELRNKMALSSLAEEESKEDLGVGMEIETE